MHIRQLLWKMLSGTLTGLRLRASDKEIIKLEKFVITGGKPLHGEVTIRVPKMRQWASCLQPFWQRMSV